MNFFNKLFKQQKDVPNSPKELDHAVIIKFDYNKDSLEPLHELGHELERLLSETSVGEHDGHEIAMDLSDGFLYLYGLNAEILFKTIRPILIQTDFTSNATAKLRFGPPEDGVSEIELNVND